MTTLATQANGLMSPPQTEKASSVNGTPPRVVLAGKTGRILCVADIRGDYHELCRLIREHEATAVIHTGDFGFITAESLERMGDKILRHLLQYSPLIPPGMREQLLNIPISDRSKLIASLNNLFTHFPLSQLPHLLSGAITFPVPVFTVWGLIEDIRVLENFRTKEYQVHNLNIIDEATSRVLDVGGLKLRLFGLGGAVAVHKLCEGFATIAGGQGTMWTTALQIGELADTAARNYDPTETRLFISSAPVSRNGLLSQVSNAVKADFTISGGLHFRYPASFNEFAVHGDFDSYRQKLFQARDSFVGLYQSVKEKVDPSLTEQQQGLLKKAIGVASKIPAEDDGSWTNTWHWVLSDASCGYMALSVSDGRVSVETKSSGLNFAHRTAAKAQPPSGPITPSQPVAVQRRTSAAPETQGRPTAPGQTTGAPPSSQSAPSATAQRPLQGNMMATKPIGPPAGFNPMPNVRGLAKRPVGPGPGPAPPTTQQPAPSAGLPNKPSQPTPSAQNQAQSQQTPTPAAPSTQPGGNVPPANRGPQQHAQPIRAPRGPTTAPNSTTIPNGPASTRERPPREPRESENKQNSTARQGNTKPPTSNGPATAVNGKSNAATPGTTTPAPEKQPKETSRPSSAKPDVKGESKSSEKVSKINGTTTTGGEKTSGSATPASQTEKKDVSGDKDTGGLEKSDSQNGIKRNRNSLYIKGIPMPTSEEDVKGLFGDSASKITNVKLIFDHFTKKQKDFAYVDFGGEEDTQEALKNCKGTIRDKAVDVSISNPPSKPSSDSIRGGGRGRGGLRGGRGGRTGSGFGDRGERGERGERKPAGTGDGEAGGKTSAAVAAAGGDKAEKK